MKKIKKTAIKVAAQRIMYCCVDVYLLIMKHYSQQKNTGSNQHRRRRRRHRHHVYQLTNSLKAKRWKANEKKKKI